MVEVTNELMYELLKRIQSDVSFLKEGQRELKSEIAAVRGTVISISQDVHNIYGILARHDERLERIENRLELRELAERGQAPFDAGV